MDHNHCHDARREMIAAFAEMATLAGRAGADDVKLTNLQGRFFDGNVALKTELSRPDVERETVSALGRMTCEQVADIIETALRERDEAAEQRDALIEAVREVLNEREPEWFPDGFPDHLAAVDAIRWLARTLAGSRTNVPSRWL